MTKNISTSIQKYEKILKGIKKMKKYDQMDDAEMILDIKTIYYDYLGRVLIEDKDIRNEVLALVETRCQEKLNKLCKDQNRQQ